MVLAALISLGLMLNVRALMALGSLAGTSGWLVFPLLLGLGWCYLMAAKAYARLTPQCGLEAPSLAEGLAAGRWGSFAPRLALTPMAARLGVFLFFGVSMLALSGYAFNEIFWATFPNLLFSFVLLALLAGFAFWGEEALAQLTLWSTLVAVMLLLILLAVAIAALGRPDAGLAQGPSLSWAGIAGLASLAPLLLGFEAGALLSLRRGRHRRAVYIPLGIGLGMLLLTAAAFLLWVDVGRLADTTVPHLTMARRAFGTEGRMLMGGAVILTTVAACGALLLLLQQALGYWLRPDGAACPVGGNAPSTDAAAAPRGFLSRLKASLPALAACAAVGALLAMGYGGEPILEDLLGGALALWLASYALTVEAAVRLQTGRQTASRVAVGVFLALALGAVLRAPSPGTALLTAGMLAALAMAFGGVRR